MEGCVFIPVENNELTRKYKSRGFEVVKKDSCQITLSNKHTKSFDCGASNTLVVCSRCTTEMLFWNK